MKRIAQEFAERKTRTIELQFIGREPKPRETIELEFVEVTP